MHHLSPILDLIKIAIVVPIFIIYPTIVGPTFNHPLRLIPIFLN
jgi:hypothetical protein